MASLIENYGFIGNLNGSALVSRDGSVDWLCIPRFDSDACMAALLGRDEHGSWSIHPGTPVRRIQRRYRAGTLILETDYECDGGAVRLIEFMPIGCGRHSLVRIIEGLDGAVPLYMTLSVRFGYGAYRPWITKEDGGDGIQMTAAPNAVVLRTTASLECDDKDVRCLVTVQKGQRVAFELSWHRAHEPQPPAFDVESTLAETQRLWTEWSGRSKYRGPYQEAVNGSLIALKAMIYAPSGGIVAAPTAGLPEEIGGVRNWDYRYCWLRDATLTLDGLMLGGYVEEATAWRQWLLNATAGAPDEVQIMYGIEGERRLTEFEAGWLP